MDEEVVVVVAVGQGVVGEGVVRKKGKRGSRWGD